MASNDPRDWPFPKPANDRLGEVYKPTKQDTSYAGQQVRYPYAGDTAARGPMHQVMGGASIKSYGYGPSIADSDYFEQLIQGIMDSEQTVTGVAGKPDVVKASQTATTGGRKFDGGKLQYGLVPPHALEEMVKVLTFGAQKYEPDNWKRVPDGKRRYFDAAMRHLWAYKRGEEVDPETGIHHLAHALCCINFILDLDLSPTPENPK